VNGPKATTEPGAVPDRCSTEALLQASRPNTWENTDERRDPSSGPTARIWHPMPCTTPFAPKAAGLCSESELLSGAWGLACLRYRLAARNGEARDGWRLPRTVRRGLTH
jgi:hypothetical protein